MQGASTMTQTQFGFKVNLGHGFVKFREVEQGIVAKAAGAARRFENGSLNGAVGDLNDLAIACCDQGAVIAG